MSDLQAARPAGPGAPAERSGSAFRLVRAFLWLRWRTLVNSLGGGGRRSMEAKIQAWVEMLAKGLLGLLLGLGALGLTLGAIFAAPVLASGGDGREAVLFILRGGLGALVVAFVFFAMFQAARGGATRVSRLLLLPVSPRRLHGLELASSLADPWLLCAVPGLLLLTGLTVSLRPVAALTVAPALVLFLAVLAALGTTLSFAVQLVFRNRRRAEWVTLMAFVLYMALLVPVVLQDRQESPKPADLAPRMTAEKDLAPAGAPGEPRVADTFPMWLLPLPSEALSFTLARASGPEPVDGSRSEAWLGVGVLALELLLLYGSSRALWRRLLGNPESGSGPRGTQALPLPSWSPPGLSPSATAVAWAQVRGVWRTLQGRLALVTPTLIVPVITFAVQPGGAAASPASGILLKAPLLALGTVALSLLVQEAVLVNHFCIDGSGLSLSFLAPVTADELVLGKAVGGAALYLASLLPALLVAALFQWQAPPLLWPAAVAAAVGTYALFAPVAAWVSILLPKAVDLGTVGKRGKAHQGAVMVGMLALGVVLAPTAAIGLIVLGVWKSTFLLFVALGFFAVASCLVAVPFLHLAGGALDRRREELLLTVAEKD